MVCAVSVDNWWCVLEAAVFSRLVDMYKSTVVFLLTGRTSLVPLYLENQIRATLRLLEKLHKVPGPDLRSDPNT